MGDGEHRWDPAGELAALRRTHDPERAVALATRLIERLAEVELAVSQLRDAGIVTLHDRGYSYQRIGAVAGLTRGRVAQVVRRARLPRRNSDVAGGSPHGRLPIS